MVGRRGPLIAGAAALVLALLLVFFLVLPKMNEVSAAQATLEDAQTEQETLETQLIALRDAQASAPQAEATIADVERQVPPTVDVQSVILLLDNAAAQSSISLRTFTPGTPAFSPTTGLTTVDISATLQGTYFSLDEFLFRVETLPRAARVVNMSVAAAQQQQTGTPTTSSELSMSATIQVFTSDASAGPGSEPGPTGEPPATEGA